MSHPRASHRAATICICLLATGWAIRTAAQPAPEQARWFKGNTHTHTLNSDGDSSPDDVVRWYREHGYRFLVLTDHNFLTSVDGLNALHAADQQFLVIKGEEVTDRFGEKPLHVNGLDVARLVRPQGGTSVVDVLQRNVDAVRKENGIPHINHPNFRWAITPAELAQVRNTRLFEIYNGHPQTNNTGGGGVPGLEEVWDAMLSSGTRIYGIAVDDAHVFKQPGNPDVAGPGRGWVMVRAERLEARLLVEALERGDFYASTGVVLDDLRADDRTVNVKVKADSWAKYRIQFVGKGGRLLREAIEPSATYSITGDEGYVRVRVLESNGRMAWTQPVFVRTSTASSGLLIALAALLGSAMWFSRARHITGCSPTAHGGRTAAGSPFCHPCARVPPRVDGRRDPVPRDCDRREHRGLHAPQRTAAEAASLR